MIVTIVICDMCDAEGIPGLSRTALTAYGWVVVGPNSELDLCPRCH